MTILETMRVAKALCADDGRDWFALTPQATDAYIEAARVAIGLRVAPPSPLPLPASHDRGTPERTKGED